MRAVVVYESMYGNTHHVADAIAAGLGDSMEVTVVPAHDATPDVLADARVVVVGGPTHVHGLPRASTRHAAVEGAEEDPTLEVEPDAESTGLREWFETLPASLAGRAAAFDTRMDVSPVLSGRASKGIAKRLRHHGLELIGEPMSFLVDKENHLVEGEDERARAWGATLASWAAEPSVARSR
jgi:hypothetical protein